MNRQELEERIGGEIFDLDWPVLQHIYNYHPDIKDVGSKDQFAGMLMSHNWNGATVAQRASSGMRFLLCRANDEAEKHGIPRMNWQTEEWYGVEEWRDDSTGVACHMKPVSEIGAWLREELGDMVDEYFSDSLRYEKPNALWPERYRWIAVFPVTGGSEGHYVHVEIITDDKRELVFLIKTFKGMEHARAICARIQDLLHV